MRYDIRSDDERNAFNVALSVDTTEGTQSKNDHDHESSAERRLARETRNKLRLRYRAIEQHNRAIEVEFLQK